MKAWQVGLGLALAAGIGAAVFLGTRKAAAADAGKKAFKVDAGCTKIEVVDADAAKSALQAAAMAEFRGRDEPARDYATRVAAIVLGCKPSSGTMISGVPGQGGISWGSVLSKLGDRSVGSLMGELGGAMQGGAVDDNFNPSPINDLASWLIADDLRYRLYRLAMLVPVPVPLDKYDVSAPIGSRAYEWGDGLYVVLKANTGWVVRAYNAYYKDAPTVGLYQNGPDDEWNVKEESTALLLSFLAHDSEMGAQV